MYSVLFVANRIIATDIGTHTDGLLPSSHQFGSNVRATVESDALVSQLGHPVPSVQLNVARVQVQHRIIVVGVRRGNFFDLLRVRQAFHRCWRGKSIKTA